MQKLILSRNKPTKKMLWLTDLHLDAAIPELLPTFFLRIEESKPGALLIGGDICNGSGALDRLVALQSNLNIPLYFVFGNHDYYGHSINELRSETTKRFAKDPNIFYLSSRGPIQLTEEIILIGHDSWADGRAGDFLNSDIYLNDYVLIEELKNMSRKKRLEKLNFLGTEAANKLKKDLLIALKKSSNILLLTHTPPFREVCCYKGNVCDDNWAPHFVCHAVGEMLIDVMSENSDSKLTVLCGHAHFGVEAKILPNLNALCGNSVLGIPSIQGEVFI